MAGGQGTNTLAYSADGITWTGLGTSIFSTTGYGVTSAPAPNLYPAQPAMNGGVGTNGTVISTNLLSAESLRISSINSFVYNLSAKPSGTTATIQFSQDGATWKNSSGTVDGTDTLTTGTNNSISLSSLSWSGANFYYKVVFGGDGTNTPVLDDSTVNYTAHSDCTSIPTSGNHSITAACAFPGTINGVDAGTGTTNTALLTLGAGGSLTVLSDQTVAVGSLSLSGGTVTIVDGGSIKIGTPLYVPDADSDGYPSAAEAASATQYTSAASGRVRRSTATDCSPADAAKWQNINGYTDADGDGYGTGSITPVCSGATLAAGYTSNNTDCNDGNASVYTLGNRFVAVGQGMNNAIIYSSDGITWTGLGYPSSSTFQGYSVAWNGTRWVAVGSPSQYSIAYSNNGIIWTGLGFGAAVGGLSGGNGVAWNGTRWVAVGSGTTHNGDIVYSSDGITWTGVGTGIFAYGGSGIAWNGTRWVAGGFASTTNNTIAYSSDGITWTGVGLSVFGSNGNVRGIAWNGTRWVAVASSSTNTIGYSSDGITWTGLGKSIFSGIGYGIAWNGTRWVAGGMGTNSLAYSADGITWTGLGTSILVNSANSVAWNGTRWVAVGSDYNVSTIAYSSDGITWTGLTGLGRTLFDMGYGVASAPAPQLVPAQAGICQ